MTKKLTESQENINQNSNSELIKKLDQETPNRKINLSGLTKDGKFFHTTFIQKNFESSPIVLFDDFSYKEVKKNNKKNNKYHYFTHEGINYIYQCYNLPSNLGNVQTIDNKGIKDFLEGKIRSGKEIYEDIKQTLQEFYDFCNEEELELCVCHIIHSYILNLLGGTIYILLNGDKGTGKTTLQGTLEKLQYHGYMVDKITAAALCRKTHFFQASLNLDEFDNYRDKEKQIILGVLNSGYKKRGVYEVVDDNNRDKTNAYYTFCTKTFSTNKISGLDSTLLSRCIIINTIGAQRSTKDITALDEVEENWMTELRNNIFGFCLVNGKNIYDNIKQYKNKLAQEKTFARLSEKISIIAGIQQYFTGRETLKNCLINKEKLGENNSGIYQKLVYFILKYFVEYIIQYPNNKCLEMENEQLLEYIKYINREEGIYNKKLNATVLGKILNQYKIVDKEDERKRIGGSGRFKYEIKTEKIKNIVKRLNFEDLVKKLNENTKDDEESGDTASQLHI